MAWSDTLPDILFPTQKGWWDTLPSAPTPSGPGWWAALDLDEAITIQFVTHAELQMLQNMGAVLAVNVNRQAVLVAIRTMAFSRGLTVTMDLGLQGIFLLSANMPIGFNRAATLSKVWAMNFSRNINFDASMALGKVMALGAANSLWSVNRVAGLDHIVPVSGSATWNFGTGATILPIHTVNLARNIGAALVADLTLIKFGFTFTDDFNRANASTPGANWRLDRGLASQILSNRLQYANMSGTTSRAGSWESYNSVLATDNYGITATFITPASNGQATDNCSGLALAVGDTFGSGTMCYFVCFTGSGTSDTAGSKIMTQSGLPPSSGIATGQSGQTTQAEVSAGVANGNVIEFRRDGNVFTVNKNGALFISWTDTGNIVSSGAGFRRWGTITEGNHPFFQSQYDSLAIDTITAKDN